MDYQREYDEYWSRPDRWGSHSFTDPGLIADQILSVCGKGKLLDVGFGMGLLLKTLLQRGVDAHGMDIAERVVQEAEQFAPGRVKQGSILDLPYPNSAFQTIISTDCMEHIAERDVPAALLELYRATQRNLFIQLATTPDRDRRWHLTIRDRAWWEARFFEAGFRKHPLCQVAAPYEALETDGRQITLVFEKIPALAREKFPLARLKDERDLHMDMLREGGRRSDAHIARYILARRHLPEDGLILDAACGLGYGSAILAHGQPAIRVIGIDNSPFAINYARENFTGRLSNVEFREGDVCQLAAVADETVDLVVSFETIEHLKDPDQFFLEVRRVLKPGGKFIGSVPNLWVDETGRDPNPWHFHVFDFAKLAALCRRFLFLHEVHRQNAGGGMKLPNAPRELRRLNLPVVSGLDEAEWWIVCAVKEEAAPFQISTPSCRRRLVLLTADPNHPLYSSWLPDWKLAYKALAPAEANAESLKEAALLVTHDTYFDPGRRLITEAVAAGIPTLILADGILEYRNTWEHPDLPPGAVFQPVLGHKIACLGRSQARHLESWGNAGKCEITGSPRFDRYYGMRRRQKLPDEPFKVLVMTALTPWFNERQHRLICAALEDVKKFFAAQQTIGGYGIQPVWRLTKGLDQELGVPFSTTDLTGRELAEVLQTVDAVVTTPSTAMLEAMMLGIPVAVLDYTNSPLYVLPAWSITAAEHIAPVIAELLRPPEPKLLFQDATLHDCLECASPATPRLIRVMLRMMECGRRAREAGLPLLFPARILEHEFASPHPRENRFQLEKLYPKPAPPEIPTAEPLVKRARREPILRRILHARSHSASEARPSPGAESLEPPGASAPPETREFAAKPVNNQSNGIETTLAPKTPKLLFISHDASRTGAPVWLLNFIRWLRDRGNSDFRILLRAGGPLEPCFRELGETHIVQPLEAYNPLLEDVALIYSNTGTNGAFLQDLAATSIPIITHVHELEHTLASFGAENFELVKCHTSHFIACSQAVADCLRERHAVPRGNITVMHECIPIQSVIQEAADRDTAEIRRWCGVDEETAVIAGCGFAHWRKGSDLFVQLANLMQRRVGDRKKVAFLWIGKLPEDERGKNVLYDVQRLGLAESVKFIGEQENPHPFLNACDVFCLCSREDPFPLVMLEIAALGKPIVCFEKAGGAAEFCARGGGFAVPYLNLEAMCGRLIQLINNEPLRRQIGKAAAHLVKNEFDLALIAPRILELIALYRREPQPLPKPPAPPPPPKVSIRRRLKRFGWRLVGRQAIHGISGS